MCRPLSLSCEGGVVQKSFFYPLKIYQFVSLFHYVGHNNNVPAKSRRGHYCDDKKWCCCTVDFGIKVFDDMDIKLLPRALSLAEMRQGFQSFAVCFKTCLN